MYNAPSVAYPVGRCAFLGRCVAGLLLSSLALMAAWAAYQPLSWLWASAWLAILVGGVGGWRAMQVQGVLQWHGASWVLCRSSSDAAHLGESGTVRLVLDTQRVLLLQWTPLPDELGQQPTLARLGVPRCSEWLWMSKDNAPQPWHDLRRAVYAQLPKL